MQFNDHNLKKYKKLVCSNVHSIFEEMVQPSNEVCVFSFPVDWNDLVCLVTSNDTDLSAIPAGECFMTVPSLNMCFSTNRLQSLNIIGSIFDISHSARPLTIQDYISILIEHDKYLDNELVNMINNLSSFSSRYKHLNNRSASQNEGSGLLK